uniref:PH domain-containing protein n=1 Tax=Lates calcarifer TaxID=8187 RepID=A0A4W6C4G8_LATCA
MLCNHSEAIRAANRNPDRKKSNSCQTSAAQGAVQMRIKNSQSPGDRLSQSKSMVLQESDLPQKPISRHRRNQSQHNVVIAGVELKGEQLNVAKISESGKKQRKNWTSMWTVLTSDQLLFYKDKQQETGQVHSFSLYLCWVSV